MTVSNFCFVNVASIFLALMLAQNGYSQQSGGIQYKNSSESSAVLELISNVPVPSCKYVIPVAKEIQYVSNIGIVSLSLFGGLTASRSLFTPIFVLGLSTYVSGKSLSSCYRSFEEISRQVESDSE